MRFAIRDDDTNFFTTPKDIEACYKDIWDYIPPSLCLISKVKGKWDYWVHQIYKDKQNTDWNAWKADDEVYPIEQNKALIKFLRTRIKEGKIDIGFHAKHHRNEDPAGLQEMSNNYVRGAEFYTSRDLTNMIRQEVNHLSSLLDYDISIFTPPQNLLSMSGYHAVLGAGLNLCGGGIPFYKKQKDSVGIRNIRKQLQFKLLHKGKDYPRALRFNDHNEISHHYPLQPETELKTLIKAFEHVRSFDGDFVLSTHYVEFDYPMTYDRKRTMKNILEEFLNYTSKYNVQYISLTELLK